MGKLELLDTPNGKIAQELVEAKYPLFVSSRAAGDVDEKTHEVQIAQIFTYDIVCTPGFAEAKLSQVSESLNINTLNYLTESVNTEKSKVKNKKYKVLIEGVSVQETTQNAPLNERAMKMKDQPINMKNICKPLLEEDSDFKLPEADVTPEGTMGGQRKKSIKEEDSTEEKPESTDSKEETKSEKPESSEEKTDNKEEKSEESKEDKEKKTEETLTDEEIKANKETILSITTEEKTDDEESKDEDSEEESEEDSKESKDDIVSIEKTSEEKTEDKEDSSEEESKEESKEEVEESTKKKIESDVKKDMDKFQSILDNLAKVESVKESIIKNYPFARSLSPENFATFAALNQQQKERCMNFVVENNLYEIKDINDLWATPLKEEKRMMKNWLRLASPEDIALYTAASIEEQNAIENMARYCILENKQDVEEFWFKTGLRQRVAMQKMNEDFVNKYKVQQKQKTVVTESTHPLGYSMDYVAMLEHMYD